jgi:linoleoyl-CoA desaturase
MKTIQFLANDLREKQFTQVVKDRVNAYFKARGISTKGNIQLVVKSVLMLLMYLVPFLVILILSVPHWITIILVVIMGIGEAGIGMSVMHDASHGAFSRKKWVNRLCSSSMFLLGSNTFNWKVQHTLLHHTYTNIYGYDQDIESKGMLRLCQHAPLRGIHRFQYLYAYFFYGLMTLYKLLADFRQLVDFNRCGITRAQGGQPSHEMLKLIVVKIVYFSVILGLPLWLSAYSWWQVLLGFSLLHFTAGIIMSTVFQMAHIVEGTKQPLPDENGVIDSEWMVHQLNTTSDFARNNIVLSWYVGGLNFQIEHHLFPHICHIHYPKIATIVEQTADEFGLRYNLKPTFGSAFLSHAKRLKELGRCAGFQNPAKRFQNPAQRFQNPAQRFH